MERLTGIKPTLGCSSKAEGKLASSFAVVEQSSIFRRL